MLDTSITIEQLNTTRRKTLVAALGIEFTEVGPDFIKARMPVDERTLQPYGMLHGGASAALAETLGSVGAALCLDLEQYIPVGLELNANHIRPVPSGYVHGTATPIHLGRRTQVWDIKIVDDQERLVCTSRLTIMVVSR